MKEHLEHLFVKFGTLRRLQWGPKEKDTGRKGREFSNAIVCSQGKQKMRLMNWEI